MKIPNPKSNQPDRWIKGCKRCGISYEGDSKGRGICPKCCKPRARR